jgi:hypothetical protein
LNPRPTLSDPESTVMQFRLLRRKKSDKVGRGREKEKDWRE